MATDVFIGVDFCDTYTQLAVCGCEETIDMPTLLCIDRADGEWYVGKQAMAKTLEGSGIIVDRLISLFKKDGTSTIMDVKYSGAELIAIYMRKLVTAAVGLSGQKEDISLSMAIAIREYDARLAELLKEVMFDCGIDEDRAFVISHSEAFYAFMADQKKELANDLVGMLDLSEEGFRYYEIAREKGFKTGLATADYAELEDKFSLNILDSPSGEKLAVRILNSCGEKAVKRRHYASFWMCGRGFDRGACRDWAGEFLRTRDNINRAFVETRVFALGAVRRAGAKVFPADGHVLLCDGRLKSSVYISMIHKGQQTDVPVALAGDAWCDRRMAAEALVDRTARAEFTITSADGRKKKRAAMELEGFPERTDRTVHVRLSAAFLDEQTMEVCIEDLGFGEIYPSSGAKIRREMTI